MKRRIEFHSYDGTRLVGILCMPDGQFEHALLMTHGIPSDKDEWGFYRDMADFMLAHNVATFRFDFRYSGESEKGQLSGLSLSTMVNDIESAYWTLKTESPNKAVSLVSTSASGGAGAKWINAFSREISSVHLMAPVLDYELEITGRPQENSHERLITLDPSVIARLRKDGTMNPDIGYSRGMVNDGHLFRAESELAQIGCSITIYHGNGDTIVPYAISKGMSDRVRNIVLVTIEDADHGFSVKGDDDLTHPDTKKNHLTVYNTMLARIHGH